MDAFLKKGKQNQVKSSKKENNSKLPNNPEPSISIKTNLPKSCGGIKKTGCLAKKEESKVVSLDSDEDEMEVDEETAVDRRRFQPWVEK